MQAARCLLRASQWSAARPAGNTHLLVADGTVSWRHTQGRDRLELGTVTVADGAVAYLLHPEHGAQGIGPGAYRIRRQRQQADEIEMVRD